MFFVNIIMFSQGQIIALVLVFLVLIGSGVGIWYYTKDQDNPTEKKALTKDTSSTTPTSATSATYPKDLKGKYFYTDNYKVQFNEAQEFCKLPNKMVEDSQVSLLNKNITNDANRDKYWGNPIWTNTGNQLLWDINQKKYRVVDKEFTSPMNAYFASSACIGPELPSGVSYTQLA